jgi:hypothetical protein
MRSVPPVLAAFVLAALTLVLAAPATPATPVVKATLKTGTPTPVVDESWRWTVTVKNRKGKPIRAKMKLQILLGTLVVGCWKGKEITQCTGAKAGTWIAFRGKKTGTLTWPLASVGSKLTFQAIVVAGGKTLRLRAPVRVQPKP